MGTRLKRLKDYTIARAKEVTTWQGITLGVTAAGYHLMPDMQQFILVAGPGVFAAVSVALSEGNGASTGDPPK